MMSSKDRVGQIIKAFITVVTLITLTSRFCIIKAAFDHMLRRTRGTCDAVGPAQLTKRSMGIMAALKRVGIGSRQRLSGLAPRPLGPTCTAWGWSRHVVKWGTRSRSRRGIF